MGVVMNDGLTLSNVNSSDLKALSQRSVGHDQSGTHHAPEDHCLNMEIKIQVIAAPGSDDQHRSFSLRGPGSMK